MLADHAEITRETVSNMERGLRTPDLSTLARIAEALEIKMEEMFRGY